MAIGLNTAPLAHAWGPEAGIYGNMEGCQFAKTGSIISDDFVVLDARGIETYGAACVFAIISPETEFGHAIVAICSNEGETEQTISHFRIKRNSERTDAYDVFDGAGMTWATAGKC